MMRGFYLTTLFALVLSFATNASAQVTLKYKFPDGRKSTAETRARTKQTLTLAGMDLESGSDQSLTISSVNGQRGADGTINVKQKIEKVKAAVTLPGGTELEFDSADPDADPPGTQFDFVLEIFKAMSNSTWTIVVNKDNKIEAVEGRADAFTELSEVLRDTMKTQLDPEYLKTAANDEMDKLTDEPVSPGDSWERTNTFRLEAGQTLTFTNKYTYTGSVEKNGKKLEKIVSVTTKVEYSADATSPLKVLESDLKVAVSAGEILFDIASGQVVSTRSKVQIKGPLKLEIMGMELPGTLDLTMENATTVK